MPNHCHTAHKCGTEMSQNWHTVKKTITHFHVQNSQNYLFVGEVCFVFFLFWLQEKYLYLCHLHDTGLVLKLPHKIQDGHTPDKWVSSFLTTHQHIISYSVPHAVQLHAHFPNSSQHFYQCCSYSRYACVIISATSVAYHSIFKPH